MGKKKGSGKKKAQKATSNVFALFSQSQIQEYKEAFNMIDQDRNGFITKEDLAGMFSSMGKDPPETYLEDVILNAFKCFDPDGKKVIPGEELKRLLTAMG